MKALTAAEMREVDRLTTERLGIPSLQLMETAGRRVADACLALLRKAGPDPNRRWNICVLCGKGNNGGDGFVAARHLSSALLSVHVFLFGQPDELKGDAAANFARWRDLAGKITCVQDEASWKAAWPEIAAADVIVDAVFGTGFRGAASGVVRQAVEDVNALSRKATAARPVLILAVDTPTGLPSDGPAADGPVLHAHHTVTFTAPKVGQLISRDCAAAGALEVVSIGSPASLVEDVGQGTARWIEPEEFAALPLVRPSDGHKGTFGHALIVAGSVGKSGAAVLAGRAALCTGAGLVTVAAPDSVLPIIATAQAEYMTEPLYSTDAGTISQRNLQDGRFAQRVEGKTVLGIGPGLGQHSETQNFIRGVVQQSETPVVLDADGLNALARHTDDLQRRKGKFLAITPHPGEMARLLGTTTEAVQADRVKTATEAARRWNVFVVLKGAHTVVASPDGQVFINITGNAGLAKGGSGDVLTGVLAALTAQFKAENWVRVLALGVYLHGLAAEIASEGTDLSGLLAGDVVNAIPHARRRLVQELRHRA
jgi:ADP-dependent NAD(P)H-hydrate dehydratase / NAD(P)H-hydrate epimerase